MKKNNEKICENCGGACVFRCVDLVIDIQPEVHDVKAHINNEHEIHTESRNRSMYYKLICCTECSSARNYKI